MNTSSLEHVNLTVSNPDDSANLLCKLFGWHIRWSGDARASGRTIHVGTDNQYLALYTNPKVRPVKHSENDLVNLNHVAIKVADLGQIEQNAIELGLNPFNHADYDPGRRFYLLVQDELEVEVVSYS